MKSILFVVPGLWMPQDRSGFSPRFAEVKSSTVRFHKMHSRRGLKLTAIVKLTRIRGESLLTAPGRTRQEM
jgi:hypothetical protein